MCEAGRAACSEWLIGACALHRSYPVSSTLSAPHGPPQVREGCARVLVLAVGVNSQQGKIGLLLQGGGGGGGGALTMGPELATGAGAGAGVVAAVAQEGIVPPQAGAAAAAEAQGVTPRAAGLGKTSFLTEKLDVLARQIG